MKPLGVCAVVAALVVGRSVAAQPMPSGLALRWEAPPSCPPPAEVEAAVARLLGRPVVPGPSPCVAHGRVAARRHGGWRLRLTVETRGRPRRRTLDGATCASLAEAAALVLALAIDPDAVTPRPEVDPAPPTPTPTPAPSLPPPLPPPPPVVIAPPSRRAPTPARRIRWIARASLFADLGALPQVTLGPAVALGLAVGPWRVEAQWFYGIARRTSDPTRGAELDLIAGGIAGCGLARWGRVDVGGCGGLEVGSSRAAAFGVSQPTTGSALWIALTFGALARVRFGERWGVVGQLGAAVPTLRPRYVIDNVGAVFRTSPITLRGAIGAEVYF